MSCHSFVVLFIMARKLPRPTIPMAKQDSPFKIKVCGPYACQVSLINGQSSSRSLCWPYSFRIGAATMAASAGIEDSTIQTLGHWQSSSYLLHVKLNPHHMASLSSTLAQCPIWANSHFLLVHM